VSFLRAGGLSTVVVAVVACGDLSVHTDGIHPSQPAYERMAERWFNVLDSVTAR
jgi:lysophospholipase L1-like esterase